MERQLALAAPFGTDDHTGEAKGHNWTNLVHRKMIKQLPKIAWESLQLFKFGEWEEALRALHVYLELANRWNVKFLEWLRQEGVQREMLAKLHDLGAVLA